MNCGLVCFHFFCVCVCYYSKAIAGFEEAKKADAKNEKWPVYERRVQRTHRRRPSLQRQHSDCDGYDSDTHDDYGEENGFCSMAEGEAEEATSSGKDAGQKDGDSTRPPRRRRKGSSFARV